MNEAPEPSGEGPSVEKNTLEHLEVPIEYVLGEQQLLMRRMIPPKIKPYVTEGDGQHMGGIEDALFERWNTKYSGLFRQFCDRPLNPEDEKGQAFAKRIQEGTLTPEDYAVIEVYLEDPLYENASLGIGGKFFGTEAEVDEFLLPFKH